MTESFLPKTNGCSSDIDIGETLGAIATSLDCGFVEKVVTSNALGVEWASSNQGNWFMQWPSIYSLLHGWDGFSTVNWFFDSILTSGKTGRAIVRVSPLMMKTFILHKIINQGARTD